MVFLRSFLSPFATNTPGSANRGIFREINSHALEAADHCFNRRRHSRLWALAWASPRSLRLPRRPCPAPRAALIDLLYSVGDHRICKPLRLPPHLQAAETAGGRHGSICSFANRGSLPGRFGLDSPAPFSTGPRRATAQNPKRCRAPLCHRSTPKGVVGHATVFTKDST